MGEVKMGFLRKIREAMAEGFGKQSRTIYEADVIESVLNREAKEKKIEAEIAETQRAEKARILLLAQQEEQERSRAKAESDQEERTKREHEREQAERRKSDAQKELRVLSALALLMNMRSKDTKKPRKDDDEVIDVKYTDVTDPQLPEPGQESVKKSESVLDKLPRRGKDGRKQF